MSDGPLPWALRAILDCFNQNRIVAYNVESDVAVKPSGRRCITRPCGPRIYPSLGRQAAVRARADVSANRLKQTRRDTPGELPRRAMKDIQPSAIGSL
jgi:hypothetical protein